ncbi:MAG: hypothetical protein MUF20_05325 [Methylotetracoccus sp.]|jgi:hypothetical protein|nr:hypothetical protein [Methylotetracoccus sp.]
MNAKVIRYAAGLMLASASVATHAAESHMAEALKHAEAAVAAADAAGIAEHAGAAANHAKIADEHLDAGLKSLEGAIEHGKMGHADLAKKAADEAVTHLKAAQ